MKLFCFKWLPIFLGPLLLFACASYREALTTSERVVLGLLLESTDGTPWGMVGSALIEKAQVAGFEVLVRTAQGGGWEIQERQAGELIKAGADLLVMVPSGPSPSGPAPVRKHPLPVPIIACGDLIPGIDLTLFVGPDLEAAGYLQARTLRERMASGGVILLGGPEDDPAASRLREGQLRALAEWEEIRGEKTEIIADLRLDPPEAGEGHSLVLELLDRPGRTREAVSAVIAFDDQLASGAAAAAGEKNLSDRVAVAGRGASLDACRRIIEGKQLLTLYAPPQELAAAAVRSAIRLVRKMDPGEVAESMGREPRLLANGDEKVPAVLLPPVLVTRATMVETVILDGLHPIEAVYGTASPE